MTLSIRSGGKEFSNWDAATVERGIETAASSFSFSATTIGGQIIPIREGSEVEVLADGVKILTGWVDKYLVGYDGDDHIINIIGRSLTSDLIDCSVPFSKEFETIDILAFFNVVSQKFGIETIENDNLFTDKEIKLSKFLIKAIVAPEIGQTAFEFLESYARYFQILMTDNEIGNLVITRASTELSKNALINVIGDKNNNIKRANRETDLSNLYGKYITQLTGYPINFNKYKKGVGSQWEVNKLLEEVGKAIDDEIRSERIYDFYPEENIESSSLVDRAKWEMGIRRARSFSYSATVQGHTVSGVPWRDNLLYPIRDDFANINGEYLCKKVIYDYSIDNGSETILVFTNKNAYTLQAELDKIILNET